MIAVVTATYKRNHAIETYLPCCLEMLKQQIYRQFVWIIVADGYEPFSELEEFVLAARQICSFDIHLIRLVEPGERGKVSWLHEVGGATAYNLGYRYARDTLGIPWCAHLDDDDVWSHDHLAYIHLGRSSGEAITFVYTNSTYRDRHLPGVISDHVVFNLPPRPAKLIHSSIAFDTSRLKTRYDYTQNVCGDIQLYKGVVTEDAFACAYVPVTTVFYRLRDHNNNSLPVDTTRRPPLLSHKV